MNLKQCVALMGFNRSKRGQLCYDSPLDLSLWVQLAVVNQMRHTNELQQCVFSPCHYVLYSNFPICSAIE